MSVQALLLPVSFFEKWLMIFAIVFLIFVPSHLLILKLIDYGFVNHYKELAIESKQFTAKRIRDSWPYISYVLNGNSVLSQYLIFSVYCSGIFLLGTLYFKSLSYFKTAMVLILVLTFVLYGSNYITKTIIGENSILQYDFGAWIQVQPRPFLIQGKMTSSTVLTWFVKLVLPVSLWLIAILRFREKEI